MVRYEPTARIGGVATPYDANRFWLNSIRRVNGATTLLDLDFSARNYLGKIMGVVAPAATKQNWTYGYSSFDELTAATNANDSSLSQTWRYDAAGVRRSDHATGIIRRLRRRASRSTIPGSARAHPTTSSIPPRAPVR
jgi:hypothetical protein